LPVRELHGPALEVEQWEAHPYLLRLARVEELELRVHERDRLLRHALQR
jgi:hypothetical protein